MTTDTKIYTYQTGNDWRFLSWPYRQVVLTTGCFDMLHAGHMFHLDYCKRRVGPDGILAVCVGNDATVRALKGQGRPIIPDHERVRQVAALACVDQVYLSEEDGVFDHTRLIKALRPQLYAVPTNDPHMREKASLAGRLGCMLISCERIPPHPLLEGISTTSIERRCAEVGA